MSVSLFAKVLLQEQRKFRHVAWSYFWNVGDYLLRKNSAEIKSPSTEFGVNSKCDLYWWVGCLSKPQAQSSQSVGGGAKADINHVSSMLLPFGAIGRLGVRLLQEHPLQRPLVDGGLYTQVNNSPCPEGSTNNTPSITQGSERRRVGNKKGKETTNIYLLSLLSVFQTFFSWYTIGLEKLEVNWLGQVNLREPLAEVWNRNCIQKQLEYTKPNNT